jgi:hypothetical protein
VDDISLIFCVSTYFNRTFPKNIFIIAGIGRMGVFLHHNNILMGLRHDPGTVRIVPGQAAFRAFDKRNAMGSAPAKSAGSCRSTGAERLCCGYEKPPCALAPVCHFVVLPFPCCHAVCRISTAGFWGKSWF